MIKRRLVQVGLRCREQRERGIRLCCQERGHFALRLINAPGMGKSSSQISMMPVMESRQVANCGDGVVIAFQMEQRIIANVPDPGRREWFEAHRRIESLKR